MKKDFYVMEICLIKIFFVINHEVIFLDWEMLFMAFVNMIYVIGLRFLRIEKFYLNLEKYIQEQNLNVL